MMDITTIILLGLLIIVIAELILIYFLARLIGTALNQINSNPNIVQSEFNPGDKAPLFREYDHKGNKVVLKELIEKKNTLLIFINTTCPTCKTIITNLTKLTDNYEINLILINVSNEKLDETTLSQISDEIVYIQAPNIGEAYIIRQVPKAFLVNQAGIIINKTDVSSIHSLLHLLSEQQTRLIS